MVVLQQNSAIKIMRGIDSELGRTRDRLSSGLKVASAKDNPSVWQTATTIRSEVRARATAQSILETSRSGVAIGKAALSGIRTTLSDIRSLLVQAKSRNADLPALQSRLSLLKSQLRTTADGATLSGVNFLTGDTSAIGYSPVRSVVFAVGSSVPGDVSFQTIDLDTRFTRLYDTGAAQSGILQRGFDLPQSSIRYDVAGLSGMAIETLGRAGTAPDVSGLSAGATTAGRDAIALATAGLSGTALAVEGKAASVPSAAGLFGEPSNVVVGLASASATVARASVGTLVSGSSGLRSGDTIEVQVNLNGVAKTAKVYLRRVGDRATLESELQRALDAEFTAGRVLAEVASNGAISVRSAVAGGDTIGVTRVTVVDGNDVTTSTLGLQSQNTWSTTFKSINGANHIYDSLDGLDLSGLDKTDRLRFNYSIRDANHSVLSNTVTVSLQGVTNGSTLAAAIDQAIGADTNGRQWGTYLGAVFDGTNVLFYQKDYDNAIAVTSITAINGDGVLANNIGLATGSGSGSAAVDARAASVSTGSDFAGPVTLETGASLDFNLGVNGSATSIRLTKATIDAALAGRADYTAGSGTISDTTQYALVVQKALGDAGVSNVAVTADGLRLKFTKSGAAADGDRLDLGGFAASSSTAVAASLTTGSDFDGPLTIASDAAVEFTLTLDGSPTALVVTQADVDAALSGRSGYAMGSGRIADIDAFASVLQASLSRQAIAGVTVAASGSRLKFAKTTAGAGSLALSGVTGRENARQASAVVDVSKPVTVADGASFAWEVTIDGVARTIQIDRSTVERALSGTSGFVAGSGRIASAAQMASVVRQALADANIVGLTVEADANGLRLSKAAAGAGSISIGTPIPTSAPSSVASTKTGSSFAEPITLGTDETLRFTIALDAGPPSVITIDRAQVEQSLAGQPGYLASSGTISSAAQLARIVAQTLTRNGISGVDVSDEGGRLNFVKRLAGTGRISIGDVQLVGSVPVVRSATLATLDIATPELASLPLPQRERSLDILLAGVDRRMADAGAAEAYLGAFDLRLSRQATFLAKLQDISRAQIGRLVDADMEKERAREKALQVRQQLALLSLQISSETQRNILALFK